MSRLQSSSIGVAVDFPGALWGQNSSKAALIRASEDLLQKGYHCYNIFGDSKSDEVKNAIASFGGFDAILIDGDHTYDGVKTDWGNYNSSAPLIAFHDIVGQGQFEKVTKRMVEVPKLWGELSQRYETSTFIDKGSKMGIGVIWK